MNRKQGFTLLEISIVLVIIGLVVAGILTGRTLIEQADLRQVTSELTTIETSVATFRLKYNALPGDMADATSIWPDQTADGNGDGICDETSEFGKQLNLAGLTQHYDANTGYITTTNLNQQISYSPFGFMEVGGTKYALFANKASVFNDGTFDTDVDQHFLGPFTSAQARYIDQKMDDGIASTGKVGAVSSTVFADFWFNCTDGVNTNYDYTKGETPSVLTQSTRVCNIIYNIFSPRKGGYARRPGRW